MRRRARKAAILIRPRLLTFVASAAVTAVTVPLSAAVTVYTDRAAFEAAIGPHVTYTFDPDQGFPAAPAQITSFGPIAVSTNGQPPAYVRPWPEGSANQTLSGGYNAVTAQPLFLAFDQPQSAIGFDMYTGVAGLFNVTFLGGAWQSYGLTPGIDARFFGIVSDTPIILFSVQNDGDGRSQQYKGIDNLTVVPEPVPLAGLLGTVALTLTSRRTTGGIA